MKMYSEKGLTLDKSQQFKADAGKTDPTLFDQGMPRAIAMMTRVLDYGALKYAAHSWKKVPDAINRYEKAGRRHMRDMDQGHNFDVESGLLHLAHEAINKMFVLELILMDMPEEDFKDLLQFNNPPQDHKEK